MHEIIYVANFIVVFLNNKRKINIQDIYFKEYFNHLEKKNKKALV